MSRKKELRRRRPRRSRYWERREDSRISRFRYICGGDEGSVEIGSALAFDATSFSEVVAEAAERLGKGAGCWAAIAGSFAEGGGAPLTIWSRRDSDIVLSSHWVIIVTSHAKAGGRHGLLC